jgi:peptidoglycan/xylan/chitin deacetylase (PgdA/CDA1 family)
MMPGRVTIKRVLKRTAGVASTLLRPFVGQAFDAHVCILMYHRVTAVKEVDPHLDNWNVTPSQLERQIAALVRDTEIVPLRDVPRTLAAAATPTKSSRPLVSLTFDDGFGNFHGEVLPILRRYGASATLFVVTRFVGSREPMPFDRWSRRHRDSVPSSAWRPVTWQELDACVASGLVTIGSHSHQHRIGSTCTEQELRAEAQESRAVLRSRLGDEHAACYSYPYGSTRPPLVPASYVDAVREAGYALAVSTDIGVARGCSDPLFLPRIEAFGLDSPAVLRAKAAGVLAPYVIPQWFRTSRRSA